MKIFEFVIFVFFAISIASIPIFSFSKSTYLLTWAIVVVTLLCMCTYVFLTKKITLDVVVVPLIAFPVSAFISSALNGFHGFNVTPMLLPLSSLFIYMFAKSSSSSKKLMFSAYVGICIFLFAFIIRYRNQFLHIDFSQRLGGEFGDENDISILLGFGLTYSLYSAFFCKKIYLNIFYLLLFVLFAICGFLTGSKIFLLILVIISVLCIFMRLGKKRWWISTAIILAMIGVLVFILTLPAFSTIATRLKLFFDTFSGNSVSRVDYSSIFRLYMFEAGIEMFLRKPLFGFGIWGFATYGGLNNGWSHNHFSEGLCNFGIVGFAIFHIPFISSIYCYFKSKADKKYTLPFLMLIFFIVSMISLSFFTQKIYAFVSPTVFAFFEQKKLKEISFANIFERKKHESFRNN